MSWVDKTTTEEILHMVQEDRKGRQEADSKNLTVTAAIDRMTTARLMSVIYSIIRRQTSDVSGI